MADSIEIERKLAFAELKPKCLAVSQLVLRSDIDPQTSQQLVKALEDLYQLLHKTGQVDGLITPSFGDYIFFPLSHIFGRQQIFIDRVIELSLQCLHVLISKCWHVNIAGELAKQLMIMVTFIIGGPPDGSRPSRASEETKLAATRCLESLFAAVTRSTVARGQFGMIEVAPSLGHSLTVLLDMTPASSYTDLQVSAIGAVHHLFIGVISDDDILASFLPGTASMLCKFLDSRTSASRKSKALVKALETLSDVLRLVLMDIKTSNLPASDGMNGTLNSDSITTIRTQSWLQATSEQVRMGLTGVCGLRKHRMLNVKKALLKLCQAIARDCPQSLASSLTVTIETLVSLSADKEESLCSQAQETTTTLAGYNDNITQVLEKSLHGWILSLPRILQANDEDKKSHLLREIAVSFKILSDLGHRSEILLDLFSRNMKESIINLTEHKAPTIAPENVMSEISSASMELIRRAATTEIEYPATIMPGKNQEETSDNTLKLLRMLGGTSIGLQLVHEHVREARIGTELSKAISTWMALNILRSAESQPQDDWFVDSNSLTSTPKASRLIAELYSVALSSLMDTYGTPETLPQLTCLSLEVLAYAALGMKEEFRPELVDCLYPIVHLFGSSTAMVQNHAILTLESISKSCGYASTKDLLVENADYLVNAVSLKLNMFNVQPEAPQVLLMMIKLCGAQLVPFLDDLVVSIFAALENYHGYEKLTESLFGVLEGIVKESAGSSGESQIKLVTSGAVGEVAEKRNQMKRKHIMTLDNVLGDLDDLIQRQSRPLVAEVTDENGETPQKPWGKDKSEPRNPLEEDEEDPESSNSEVKKEDEPKPTHTYLMIESIARLSQNFLTSRSPSLRLHLLHLISTASPLLSKQEDNFLPLINQLWPVVAERLRDSEPHVAITTIKTITRLCIDCGEFLSSRMEELWPVIREIAIKAKRQVDADHTAAAQRKSSTGSGSVVKRGGGQSLNSYAMHNQVWSAVVPLFEVMAGYTRITEGMFDEIVGMVAQDLADGGEEYSGLRRALEGVDRDVVWLEMAMRSEEMRGKWKNVPDSVIVEVEGKHRVIAFEPVAFSKAGTIAVS
ncbi:hypothetical protein H072_8014 [Dactylellina haptotyla CBS 200.50]|uniref:TEL2-interacting protein 1 n=1 Tax=Dactylellina haptotyla (strain CBS 200.50) TaxID=1284197 RepID=S8BST5_DACHA|nr:hypothetical protein H072_8014 [Dactylellina haptotyla CBS 200.50]